MFIPLTGGGCPSICLSIMAEHELSSLRFFQQKKKNLSNPYANGRERKISRERVSKTQIAKIEETKTR